MQKRSSHHFLQFTKKEKNGTLFLLLIIFLLIVIPFVYPIIFTEKETGINEFKSEMAVLKSATADSNERIPAQQFSSKDGFSPGDNFKNKPAPLSLFYFDPNTLSAEGWKKTGLRDKTIATIERYLSKGGRFHEPGDIKKIWGLREDEVSQLLPYIKIEQSDQRFQHFKEFEKKDYPSKSITAININEADSAAYVSLQDIGPGFAKRILKFRDKLGGFYSVQQISETYGLPDSVFQKIKTRLQVSATNIKKININTASVDEMKEHPYIRYQLANAIREFRTQHGNFNSVDDIKKIMLVTEELFGKLSPYLATQ